MFLDVSAVLFGLFTVFLDVLSITVFLDVLLVMLHLDVVSLLLLGMGIWKKGEEGSR